MKSSTFKKVDSIFSYIAIFLICLLISLPIISMVGTSFKTSVDARSSYSIFPQWGRWYSQNFSYVLTKTGFGHTIINSAIVSISAAFFCIILSSMAGYALSRWNTKVTKAFITLLLALQMMPMILILVPTFIIYRSVHLTNSLLGLIINYTSSNLAFSIWMLKGFFATTPKELDEAAMVDGCTRFEAFYKILLPIASPGISTVAIFTFVRCWNEYMVAKTLIVTDKFKTINQGLQLFVAEFGIDWALMSAAATIATIPTIVFLVFAQKYLVQGMTAGAVKG
jgi:ABC-type glycerol-3-phosphate transport system permease component